MHGRFECYYNSEGTLVQRQVYEQSVAESTPAGYCTFEPKKSAAYLIVNAVGGGGAGGTVYGGSSGEFKSLFLNTTTHTLHIYPGLGAVHNDDGTFEDTGAVTRIYDNNTAQDIISLDGGLSSSGTRTTIKNCSVGYSLYICSSDPYCLVDNVTQKVTVGYCDANSTDNSANKMDSIDINYTSSGLLKNYSSGSNLSNSVLSYNRAPDTWDVDYLASTDAATIYTLYFQLEGNFTNARQVSTDFDAYINGLDINDGIGALSPRPGTGGAVGEGGFAGAVIIAW